MRIVAAELHSVSIPVVTPLRTAPGRVERIRSAILRVRTEAGHQGLGELRAPGGQEPSWRSLADALLGLEIPDGAVMQGPLVAVETALAAVEGVIPALDGAVPAQRGPNAARRAARAAAASALLDAATSSAGQSLAMVLGRPAIARVAVNGLIDASAPSTAAAEARRLVESGFACLKVKAGAEPTGDILDRLAAIRGSVGSRVALRLDLNGSLDEDSATSLLRRLVAFGLEYVEQPLRETSGARGLARLRAAVGVPLAADESVTDAFAAERLLRERAVDALVVKPARVGGLSEAGRIVELAGAAGVPVTVSTFFETGVGIAAALHLAATVPGAGAHGLATASWLATDLLTRPLAIERGRMMVPGGPGLGIELDPAARARIEVGAPLDVART
jgi:L-alanine-DL-glutamate epimerase-like enolase superfamily enzyme